MTKLLRQLLKLFSCLACLMPKFVASLAQESMANSIHWAYRRSILNAYPKTQSINGITNIR